jgi:hypothetical protein
MPDPKLIPRPANDRVATGQGESSSTQRADHPLPPLVASLVGAWWNRPIVEADYREHLERKYR